MCDKQRLKKILDAILAYSRNTFGDRLSDVILYGSYARGDNDDGSDIDVIVLVNMEKKELGAYMDGFDGLASRLSLEDESCTTVSLIVDSRPHVDKWLEHIPFYQNVLSEGVRLSA